MPMNERIFVAIVALLFSVTVLHLARGDRLHAAAAAWWLGGTVLLLVLGVVPELLGVPATALGLALPPYAPLGLACVFCAARALFLDVDRTRRELELRRLVRRHAHLELRLLEIERALVESGTPLPTLRGDCAAAETAQPDC